MQKADTFPSRKLPPVINQCELLFCGSVQLITYSKVTHKSKASGQQIRKYDSSTFTQNVKLLVANEHRIAHHYHMEKLHLFNYAIAVTLLNN